MRQLGILLLLAHGGWAAPQAAPEVGLGLETGGRLHRGRRAVVSRARIVDSGLAVDGAYVMGFVGDGVPWPEEDLKPLKFLPN